MVYGLFCAVLRSISFLPCGLAIKNSRASAPEAHLNVVATAKFAACFLPIASVLRFAEREPWQETRSGGGQPAYPDFGWFAYDAHNFAEFPPFNPVRVVVWAIMDL